MLCTHAHSHTPSHTRIHALAPRFNCNTNITPIASSSQGAPDLDRRIARSADYVRSAAAVDNQPSPSLAPCVLRHSRHLHCTARANIYCRTTTTDVVPDFAADRTPKGLFMSRTRLSITYAVAVSLVARN